MHRPIWLAFFWSLTTTACGGLASGSAGAPDGGPTVDAQPAPDARHGPRDAPAAPPDARTDAGEKCALAHRVLKTDSSPIQMLTDAERLYWFDNEFGPARVFVTDKCVPGPVMRLARLPELGSQLAEDATYLYLATFSSPAGGDAGVYAISKANGAVQKLVDAPMGANGVAVSGGWVYWTEANTNRVGRIRSGGGGGPEILPFLMTAPERVAVLLDGTVCVVGTTVQCMLPSSTIVTLPVPPSVDGPLVDPRFLSNDDHAIYLAARDPAGAGTVLRATPSPSPTVDTVLDNPADAGMLALSGVVALADGVYVACGTGTVVWVPSGGSPLTQGTIASTLPPFVFFADADGVYWDADNGVELGPPIAP